MKLKWNWGTGIALFIIAFLLVNTAIIIFAFGQKVDLVTPNYYEKELKYQDEINAQQKTLQLSEEVKIETAGSVLSLQIPNSFAAKISEGTILLYRPDDSVKDVNVELKPDSTGLQIIQTNKLASGFWKVKINWKSDGVSYSDEKSVFIK